MKSFYSLREDLRFNLAFEWNAASGNDWHRIELFFVSAYMKSYRDSKLEDLSLSPLLVQEATMIWQASYAHGLAAVERHMMEPLRAHFSYEPEFLEEKFAALKAHFANPAIDISAIRQDFIKLIALAKHFRHDFETEKKRLETQPKGDAYPIDYVLVRHREQPIAFFICHLNYKSACVYLRWVTMDPGYHRNGIGTLILQEIAKHYPSSKGFEVYTRNANLDSIEFYKNTGFQPIESYEPVDFSEPAAGTPQVPFAPSALLKRWLLSKEKRLTGPADDAARDFKPYKGFVRESKKERRKTL
jgi:GNAT superfamily N-acetyltransferase